MCCKIGLGEFLGGGVQAEGVVKGGIGGLGGLEKGGNSFVCILYDGECRGCSVFIGG